ncbi:MAG: hypothetical protein COX66_19350 [Elusimicrobia bacterium CG_4_10_14_0_2_um_filter_63_34]|nr:MAG: hypothetical protein COX66_19350 [Elusimicrobia bacterium CG_4_10_14_0_2_um_filter_63_34]
MKSLKEVVAGLASVPVEEIDAFFALDRPGLDSSLKRAVLIASIRKNLGKHCMEAGRAKTFSELEDAVAKAPPA